MAERGIYFDGSTGPEAPFKVGGGSGGKDNNRPILWSVVVTILVLLLEIKNIIIYR